MKASSLVKRIFIRLVGGEDVEMKQPDQDTEKQPIHSPHVNDFAAHKLTPIRSPRQSEKVELSARRKQPVLPCPASATSSFQNPVTAVTRFPEVAQPSGYTCLWVSSCNRYVAESYPREHALEHESKHTVSLAPYARPVETFCRTVA